MTLNPSLSLKGLGCPLLTLNINRQGKRGKERNPNVVNQRVCLLPQDLVEKVVVLRRAVEQAQRGGAAPTASGVLLEEMMGQYASLLASQGSLATAVAYLSGSTNQVGPAA